MHSTFQILQLNVGKRREVQQSLLNDETLRGYGVLAISEPYARMRDDTVVTVPAWHSNWTKLTPTMTRDAAWPIRSMLWIRSDIEAVQIPVASADLTAARLRLPDREVLMVSVYVQGGSEEALEREMKELGEAIKRFRDGGGIRTDVILAGDFNRHDQLWGGDEVSTARQGEGDAVIELMEEHSLCSLLPRGTKTWQAGNLESTIDLVLTSSELADQLIKCQTHACDHGSDHMAIETKFDISVGDRPTETRLLFKNAPWKQLNARVAEKLERRPWGGGVQEQTDRLMGAVTEAIDALVPKAKPSPYAKRWWTTDLSRLRRVYTHWRNQARSRRRAGQRSPELERRAKVAAKEYHDAIRKQKSTHWNDFLADDTNIWQAAKYLQPDSNTISGRVPPLTRGDGSVTEDNAAQAEELLATFFPPLPSTIGEEGPRTQRRPVHMPELMMEEVERKVLEAKPWKAAGEDGLPAMVWRQLWPTVKDRVLHLFKASLEGGTLPSQWRNAKIVPLKKPGKGDYTVAKSWRPISLLSTLGKILEAVIAERISHAVETWGLLPTNHFGARKRRSAEQALILLQEHIYKAWRNRDVLSLISFDVKGAYNGVFKDRLLQRLGARGIPETLVKWIDAFCSERTATVVVNGQASEKRALPQAGLPQGSPLSPVLFLFFNADLVQDRIYAGGGAIAFVDDYTAWVTGPTADTNRAGIQAIIDRALDWERRSGATFEGEKTAIVHFTRCPQRSSNAPYTIKGESIKPQESAKILGVILDRELRYKQHVARAASRGLNAALALKRLKMMSPKTARQLFIATVAPVVDYASNVWMHARRTNALAVLNRVQKIGAQAVTGAFRTVATAVAEAEAGIRTVAERQAERATKLWVYIHTLPPTHPLATLQPSRCRRYVSPPEKIAAAQLEGSTNQMETIKPYAIPPWTKRLRVAYEPDREKAAAMASNTEGLLIVTSSSAQNDLVGLGACTRLSTANAVTTRSSTLGTKDEQNPYTAELVAMAMALGELPDEIWFRRIVVISRNLGALTATSKPRQQSGQEIIRQIYNAANYLRGRGNSVELLWAPADDRFPLGQKAKTLAQGSTTGQTPSTQSWTAKSTATRLAISRQRQNRQLPEGVGHYTKFIDTALPGRHTLKLYNGLKREEANILAQLRTGMTRLNTYLHKIKAAESDRCDCGESEETVRHFLFRCTRWTSQRIGLVQGSEADRENLSFWLGGKAPLDTEPWTPNMKAVHATIKFAKATGRLTTDHETSN